MGLWVVYYVIKQNIHSFDSVLCIGNWMETCEVWPRLQFNVFISYERKCEGVVSPQGRL